MEIKVDIESIVKAQLAETVKEALSNLLGGSSPKAKRLPSMFDVGKKILCRPVTHYCVGEVAEQGDGWILLRNASWVPNSGNLNKCLPNGEIQTTQWVGEMVVFTGAMVDAFPWIHDLPKNESAE